MKNENKTKRALNRNQLSKAGQTMRGERVKVRVASLGDTNGNG